MVAELGSAQLADFDSDEAVGLQGCQDLAVAEGFAGGGEAELAGWLVDQVVGCEGLDQAR